MASYIIMKHVTDFSEMQEDAACNYVLCFRILTESRNTGSLIRTYPCSF